VLQSLYWQVRSALVGLAKSERGATAVEYGLMVALIAAVIVVVVATLGGQTSDAFQSVSDNMP
jgi:pilus assembly protein Flp/PilA